MSSPRDQWLRLYEHENATTLKVMRAFPAEQADF